MDWMLIWSLTYGTLIMSTIALILLENRNPLKALSWVIILLLVPILGLIVYLAFGKDTRRIRLISRRSYARIMEEATPKIPFSRSSEILKKHEKKHDRLISMVQKQTGNKVLPAQEIEIFTNGKSKFDHLLRDIDEATHHIHIEYYIFRDDETGRKLADALIAKAKSGVAVRLIYDHVGSAAYKKRQRVFFRRMRDYGIQTIAFMPVVFPLLTSKENYRNHRKIIVIDGRIGYIGGMNVSDNYTRGTKIGIWRDTHFRMTGLAVNGLQAAFITDWYVASKEILSSSLFYSKSELEDIHLLEDPSQHLIPVQTLTSGPTGHFRTLQHTLCEAIYGARKSVRIHTPYFLPTDSLYKAIVGAALSGIKVELLVPYDNDVLSIKYASRSYYEDLLRAGVKVISYHGGFLHSKLVTIDGELSIIGSANIDFRSMEHNFEIASIVYDKDFTRSLENEMKLDTLLNGVTISRQRWKKRPLYTKFVESFFRLFAPLL